MNKQLSIKEFKTLASLTNSNNPTKAPKGLTEAQYYSALKSLKVKDMIMADFEEGGGIVDAKIKMEGQAALDDYLHIEKLCLRQVLRSKNLSLDQYELMIYARKNNVCKNIFGIDDYHYKSNIEKPLFDKHLITSSIWRNDHSLSLSEKGEKLLMEIDDLVEKEIIKSYSYYQEKLESPLNGDSSVADKQDSNYISNIHIAQEHITDFIKVLFSQCELGYFKDQDNKDLPKKKIMDELAKIFNIPQLTKYSSYLNNACNTSTTNTYLRPFFELENNAKDFKEGKESRRINK